MLATFEAAFGMERCICRSHGEGGLGTWEGPLFCGELCRRLAYKRHAGVGNVCTILYNEFIDMRVRLCIIIFYIFWTIQ